MWKIGLVWYGCICSIHLSDSFFFLFNSKVIRDGDITPSQLRVVVYDEADLALEQTSDEDLTALFRTTEYERDFPRLTYLVGASVTESLGKLCVKDSVLPQGKSFIATAGRFDPLATEDSDYTEEDTSSGDMTATFKDLGLCLDPGLRHERVIAPEKTGLICLARMLRKELLAYEDAIAQNATTGLVSTNTMIKTQRPRVVVFFSGEDEAREAIEPMRDALWGIHKLCVLLPNSGVNPLTIMEQFKNSETSVMLATPDSVRGLDFANLTHVYTLHLPVENPREYIHLAGRVGRIGQMGSIAGTGGRVTSILKPDEADNYQHMANQLNFQFVDVEYEEEKLNAEESNVEDMRRYLEDAFTLLSVEDDDIIDGSENMSE